MAKNKEFIHNLEDIYINILSAKGDKNKITVKSLINYAIGLTIYDPEKGNRVIQFLRDSYGKLPEYLRFFDGLNDIRVKK